VENFNERHSNESRFSQADDYRDGNRRAAVRMRRLARSRRKGKKKEGFFSACP
jgi:hypothetical protein